MEAPEYFTTDGYFSSGNCYYDKKPAENVAAVNHHHFTVDDLLDFSKAEEVMTTTECGVFDNVKVNSAESTVVDSCNSSVSGGEAQFSGGFADGHFSGELCVPYDDLAELEWLSNFVEDSFSSDEFQNQLHLISPATNNPPHIATSSSHIPPRAAHLPPLFPSDISVPGKARSKRSRAAPCDWSSRLLLLSSPTSSSEPFKTSPSKKRDVCEPTGRKCLHCGSEKTPQWRTGPMGPKTLCNACGVRFKSGRLVAEYRPAASPTFVSAKHSNSHRKVLELRRQKEFQMQHQQQFVSQSSIFGASNGGEHYLIHHRDGPDYGHMI